MPVQPFKRASSITSGIQHTKVHNYNWSDTLKLYFKSYWFGFSQKSKRDYLSQPVLFECLFFFSTFPPFVLIFFPVLSQ